VSDSQMKIEIAINFALWACVYESMW
jgi:hypothetical protein